eukprot:EG_transcript_16385
MTLPSPSAVPHFGACAAVSRVDNPIQLAKLIMDRAAHRCPLGRVRPTMLCGRGAWKYAQKYGLKVAEEANSQHLVTEASRRRFKRNMDLVLQSTAEQNPDAPRLPAPPTDEAVRYDTVGAVCLTAEGEVAAGVSSGGLLLKVPGRVGEAAVYGAGCWVKAWLTAEGNAGGAVPAASPAAVGCSVTGVGESVAKALLAKQLVDRLAKGGVDGTEAALRAEFAAFAREHACPAGAVGALRQGDRWAAWWAFDAPSMGVALFAPTMRWPHARVHRREAAAADDGPAEVVVMSLTDPGPEDVTDTDLHPGDSHPGFASTLQASGSDPCDEGPPAKVRRTGDSPVSTPPPPDMTNPLPP